MTKEKEYKINVLRGRWSVTLPAVLAQAMDLNPNDRIVWKASGKGELTLKRVVPLDPNQKRLSEL